MNGLMKDAFLDMRDLTETLQLQHTRLCLSNKMINNKDIKTY